MSQEDKQRLKEYQKNYYESEKSTQFFYLYCFFHNIKNSYSVGKHYFLTNKKPININEIDIKK